MGATIESMARAIALTLQASDRMADSLRFILVTGCALALIAAGETLPL